MHSFAQTATKLLKECKNLIRKNFSSEESQKILIELDLHGSLPRQEANLYRLLVKVADQMSKIYKDADDSLRYSGPHHFISHAKEVLKGYKLVGKQVIHIKQTVSREAVKALQLMSLPESRLTDSLFTSLDQKALLIARHGEKELKHFFHRSLHINVDRHPEFFRPLIENYGRYLGSAIEFKHANHQTAEVA